VTSDLKLTSNYLSPLTGRRLLRLYSKLRGAQSDGSYYLSLYQQDIEQEI